MIKFILFRKISIDRLPAVFCFPKKFWQAMVTLRTDDNIDHRRTPDDFRPLRLSHATGDSNTRFAPLLCSFILDDTQSTQLGINLFRSFLAYMACIQNDEISILRAICFGIAFRCEHICHARCVIDVHLAAK